MATKTIQSIGGDYATPQLWESYVAALGTLSAPEIGEMAAEEFNSGSLNMAGGSVVTNALTSWAQVIGAQGPGSITWSAATDTFTYSAGGDARGTPANGDTLMFSSAAISAPGGLSGDTIYYMVNVNTGAKTFQLASSPGGAALNITSDGSISDSSRYGGKMASASNTELDGFDSANSTKWKAYAAMRWTNAHGIALPSGFKAAYDAVLGSGGSDPPPTSSFQNDTNVYDLADTF